MCVFAYVCVCVRPQAMPTESTIRDLAQHLPALPKDQW